MKKKEFPETLEDTIGLMNDLSLMVENETDREKRRELFLLKIELKEHLIQLEMKNKKRKRVNQKRSDY